MNLLVSRSEKVILAAFVGASFLFFQLLKDGTTQF